MFEAERQYMKAIDEKILSASGKELKRLQELDLSSQLDGISFYEVYVSKKQNKEKENFPFTTKHFRK